jgi:carboxypeptidase Taq
MTDSASRLDTLISEVSDLRSAGALLSWDERVCMPVGGVTAHGHMLATVGRIAHEKFTSDEVGRLIERAQMEASGLDPDSATRRKLAVTARDYDKATRVPAEFVAEHARVSSAGHQAWREAKAQSNFTLFEPSLARLVELKRQYIEFFPAPAHPYDVLLDDFEPGALTSDVEAIFGALRPRQVALLRAIRGRPSVDDGFLRVPYAEPAMLEFAREVATAFGFDWQRGRQDKSAHPFATSMGSGDVRITTRFDPQHPFEMLFSTLHETGHALYEQGISPDWNRTLLCDGASLGIHESQSRLWENIVGRSRPFWEHFYPRLCERFPSQLAQVTLDQFYRAINHVQPSLIRVEADEVTYNLHVMLRVEMEIAMLTGQIAIGEAPDLWNAKMEEYLGVTPSDASSGILQDVHWSVGLFGYFATYTIGNLISVQIWDAFRAREAECDSQIAGGQFARLREWLRDEIHRHGRSHEPRDIVARVTGSPLDPAPYLAYLERKYRDVYGL